jgi:hypothetical protein
MGHKKNSFFTSPFSFFSSLLTVLSLLSFSSSSQMEKVAVGKDSDAVAGEFSRRRHRVGVKTLFF